MPTSRRSLAVALALASSGLTFIGCGDDDDGRLSKTALIEAGDAICLRALEDTEPLFAELFPTGSEMPAADDAAGPMGKAAQILRREHDDLAALRPPSGDEDVFDEIVERFDDAVREVEKSAARASDGDTDGYLQALEHANEVDAE